MKFFDILLTALEALRGNWMRSILTALGVIIGIAAVIVMVSVGRGTQVQLDETISRLGSNRLDINSGSGRTGGARGGAGSLQSITEGDAEAILKEIDHVQFVATSVRGSAQIVNGALNWSSSIQGVNEDYFAVENVTIALGEPISAREFSSGAKVALIGKTVQTQLFEGADPVGQTIRIARVPFRVVGVLAERGQSWGGDRDDVIIMPINTAKRRVLGNQGAGDAVGQISLGVDLVENLEFVETETAALLRQRHKLGPGAQDDFQIRNLAEMIATRSETTRLMSLLLGAVALISLIVGGIGIMNIMLVSVTERIREIGLRLAVGATPAEIRSQFLSEAMALSLGGGIIGILIGVAGTYIASMITALPVALSLDVILLAAGFSVLTGLFFGYYPAHKASQLDPIEALRRA